MIKKKLYNYFVRKNGRVWYEYERYVREHIEEHHLHRFRHIRVLIKLNWFYRIKKGNTPYLYWDVPLEPTVDISKEKTIKKADEVVCSKCVKVIPEKPLEPTVDISKEKTIKKADEVVRSKCVKVIPEKKYELKSENELIEIFGRYDVISFDVFDTLVFRSVKNATDIFEIMAIEMDKSDFKEIRTVSEKECRKKYGGYNREIEIEKIYDYMNVYYSIDKKWMNREIELELTHCHANPFFRRIYNKLDEMNKTIIAVSDMYLPTEIVEKILSKCGYNFRNRIYVSCDCMCTKRNGTLQSYVRNIYRNCKIIHIGDNWEFDIIQSKIIGWDTYYYKNIHSYNKNNRFYNYQSLTGSLYESIIDEEFHSGVNSSTSLLYKHGFKYGGILVCAYCDWLNLLCNKENIDQFVFLARDADIICKIYNKYYKKVDSAYLITSRFALYHLVVRQHINDIIKDLIERRKTMKKSIGMVLVECGLECLNQFLYLYGLKEEDVLSATNIEVFKEMILENIQEVEDYYSENKEAALTYIREKIKHGVRKICIVDIGWKGTTAQMLTELIHEIFPDINIVYAFLGTIPNINVESKLYNHELFTYGYSIFNNFELMQSGRGMFHAYIELIHISAAPSLLKYQFDEQGNVQFVYEKFCESNYLVARQIQKGILEFAKRYISESEKDSFKYYISPYDALGPLKGISNEHRYFEKLYGNYRENLVAGNVQQSKTISEILKQEKYI